MIEREQVIVRMQVRAILFLSGTVCHSNEYLTYKLNIIIIIKYCITGN